MTIEEIYSIVWDDGINVVNFFVEDKKGTCFQIFGRNYIGLNQSLLTSDADEKCILTEEYCHLCVNALYYYEDISNPCRYLNVRKAERRAKDKSASMLVPLEELKKASAIYKEAYELAEYFDVTEDIIYEAINYYRRKNLL